LAWLRIAAVTHHFPSPSYNALMPIDDKELGRPGSFVRTVCYFLAALVLALATRTAELYRPMHSDYSMWLRVARDWAGGQQLYGDAYDNKLPTIYLMLRLIDSSHPKLSLYLAQSLLAAAGAVVLRRTIGATSPLLGFAAPLVLVAWSSTYSTSVGGQTTEAFALWFDVIALSCFALSTQNGAVLMLLAGLSFFVAASLRFPCVLNAIAYLPFIVVLLRERGMRSTLGRLGIFVLGFAVGFLALFTHAEAGGYWPGLVEVFQRNLNYGSMARVGLGQSLAQSFDVLKGLCQENPAVIGFGAITMVMVLAGFRQIGSAERTWLFASLLWFAAAVASTFPGGRHFPHYYEPIWPSLSILAAFWLVPLQSFKDHTGATGRIALGVVVGVVALTLLSTATDFWRWRKTVTAGTDPMATIDEAAGYLSAKTDAGALVPICVWGHWAELYWRVPRPSVTTCTVPPCIAEIEPGRFQAWVTAMVRQRPPLIVADSSLLRVPDAQAKQWLENASAEWLASINPVQQMIDADYQVIFHWDNPSLEGTLFVLARREN
jgi:hypothetical protein